MILIQTLNIIVKKCSALSFLVVLTTFLFCFHVESNAENKTKSTKTVSSQTKVNKIVDSKNLKLSNYKWENRLLVVPDMESEVVSKQQQLFDKNPAQNKDRKLLLLKINDPKILKDLKLKNDKYSMVLIGLDGYVKNRYSDVTEMSDIYDVIDAMPMRQSEKSN